MKFLPKCRTKSLKIIYKILGSFCLFLNLKRADTLPQIRPRKIPELISLLKPVSIYYQYIIQSRKLS